MGLNIIQSDSGHTRTHTHTHTYTHTHTPAGDAMDITAIVSQKEESRRLLRE